jgi:hypothetical protein
LLLILTLTLVRGLVYLVVFPPWQHYDEPTHFEYVRLIAERGCCPQPGDYDLAMRQEIASSMQAADFWKGRRLRTINFWSEVPPDIGISELVHPPVYYALLAVPQQLVAHQDVETQLYIGRLGSILLNLVVVACAFGVTQELLPHRQWLPVAVAAFVSLLAPFTDLMSAVNNDVGAAAATSLLLWVMVRLVMQGPSIKRIAGVLLLTGVCLTTKSTAGAVALAALVALVAGFIPRAQRRWLWPAMAVALPVILLASLTWGGHAAHWYSEDPASATNRVKTASPLGQSVFVLSADGDDHPRTLFQELRKDSGQSLRGHTVTAGAWLKADGQAGVIDLRLDGGPTEMAHTLTVTDGWQFRAISWLIPKNAPDVAVHVTIPRRDGAAQRIYVDGLVLIDGIAPVDVPPDFDTSRARTGQWGSLRITNLLQNGSAESVWPGLRTRIGELEVYRQPLAQIVHSVWEASRSAWVYGFEFSILLQSFWGTFGWNHLALPSGYFYALGIVSGTGIVGSAIKFVRDRRKQHEPRSAWWRAWVLLTVAVLVAWGAAILRIHPVFLTQHLNWPVARYASAAIVPTALLLCLGLAELTPRFCKKEVAWMGLLGMVTLEAIALGTIVLPYYYG